MVWSVVLGGLGLLQDMSRENKAQRRYDSAEAFNREMARQSMDWMEEDRARYNRLDDLNRGIRGDERAFAERELGEYKSRLLKEREFEIERMLQMDREAARQYAFKLEQYLRNQEITGQERERALQELEDAKAIAAGERDEDQRRFEMAKAQKEVERDYQIQQINNARVGFQQERNDMLRQRKMISDRIQGMQTGLENVYAGLQDIPDVTPVTQARIDAEVNKRADQYIGDVDRAADRVASVAEGGLINRGMDNSTLANQTRGDIASRLADEYQNARFRAYDDAMKYIGGQQNIENTDINQILASRQSQLGQYGDTMGAGLAQMANLPDAPSSMGYMNYMPASSIYDRGVGSSANAFQDKYGLRSGISSGYTDLGSELASLTGVNTSGAASAGLNLGSGVYDYSPQNWSDPSSYSGNMLTSASERYNKALEQSKTSGGTFGKAFLDWNYGTGEYSDMTPKYTVKDIFNWS
jgi:hypothetical protein